VFHAVGAEEGHVLDSRGLCFIEKCRDVLGEIETHDGSHQVDATNAVEGRAVAVAPAPVEVTSARERAAVRTGRPRLMRAVTTREPVLPVEPSTSVNGSCLLMTIPNDNIMSVSMLDFSSICNVILSINGPIA
jgi:hypothetical protein